MKALEALLYGHPTASLLILAAGAIWLAIYFATHNIVEKDFILGRDWVAPVRSAPASDDKRRGDR